MAMEVRITVWCESEDKARRVCKLAFDRAAELVKVFSDYDAKSEIRTLTRKKFGKPRKVSGQLFEVLVFSRELNSASNGAFDPTIGPAIRFWRDARKRKQFPNLDLINNTLEAKTGFDKVKIDRKFKTVTLLADGMAFDFGGVAKGYIGDQVIDLLKQNEIKIACFRAGGDFVLGERPPGTAGWSIEVGQIANDFTKKLELESCGVSTSGDTVQFFNFGGKKYSHVVDPRTGIGLTNRRQAIVVAPSGMRSDALATVGCVLEEAQFQELLSLYEKNHGLVQNG